MKLHLGLKQRKSCSSWTFFFFFSLLPVNLCYACLDAQHKCVTWGQQLNRTLYLTLDMLKFPVVFYHIFTFFRASLVARSLRIPPAMQEVWVWSLDQENPLEKGMVTRSSILARGIPWTEKPGGLQSMGSQRVRHDWATNTHTYTYTHLHTYTYTYIHTHTHKSLCCAEVVNTTF